MHLQVLLKNSLMGGFQVTFSNFGARLESRKHQSLDRQDLSSQHVTLTTASFLKVFIKAFILAILCLLLDGSK